MPQVLIVERDPMARLALGRLLSTSTCLSGAVGTIREAEYLPTSTPLDVVLVGADVPDMQGTEGIPRLLTRFPSARVVVLIANESPDVVVEALRQGADGVLPRDSAPDGLRRAVRGVLQEKAALPRAWARFVADALRADAPAASIDDNVLSPREHEVLGELALGRSNAEIGIRLGLKESTIKTHVSNILRKTGARSRHALHSRRRGGHEPI